MQIHKNIRIDTVLAKRITEKSINCTDLLKLSAAQMLCKTFEGVKVCLVPQQQTAPILQKPPAIFVQIFEMKRKKLLNAEKRWEMGVNIAYLSEERNAESEQLEAIAKIMDAVESFPTLGGQYPYRMYNVESCIVDGIANITGTVSVCELDEDESPLIRIADQNVFLKE